MPVATWAPGPRYFIASARGEELLGLGCVAVLQGTPTGSVLISSAWRIVACMVVNTPDLT